MLVGPGHPLFTKCVLIDQAGFRIGAAQSYDTETKEAVILLTEKAPHVRVVCENEVKHFFRSGEPRGVTKMRARLPGCTLRNRETGEEIK